MFRQYAALDVGGEREDKGTKWLLKLCRHYQKSCACQHYLPKDVMSLKLRLPVVALRTGLVGGVCTEVEVDVNLAGEGARCAFCRGDVDGEASYPTEGMCMAGVDFLHIQSVKS